MPLTKLSIKKKDKEKGMKERKISLLTFFTLLLLLLLLMLITPYI